MRHHATYKKPLLGKVIYIDLAGNVHGLQTVQEKLKLLGAELESCFSKEVDYLITNKEYAKPTNMGTSPSHTSPGGTPSPFGVARGSVESPREHSPATGETRTSCDRLSRGQKLLNARRKKTYASIIENAMKWNIKIISYENAQKYIERELKNMPDSVKNAASSKSKTYEKKKKKVNTLKGPFVKFEAASRHYRPVHQELPEIPVLNFNTTNCPFDKKKVGNGTSFQHDTQEERAERGNEKDTPVLEGTPGASRHSKRSEPKPPDKGKKAVHKTSGQLAAPLAGSSTKVFTAGDLKLIMREKAQAEAKKGYCEICRVPYDDIKKHQWNTQHRNFITNPDNFIGLDNMIESGPNFEQFLSDVVKYHQDHVKEGLAESEMDDEVLLIKEGLSSPCCKPASNRTKAGVKRAAGISPKKRLFSAPQEVARNTTESGNTRSPKKSQPLRRKVIPKRLVPSTHPKIITTDGISKPEQHKTGFQSQSTKVPKSLPKISPRSLRLPRASPRQPRASPRLLRQSPRVVGTHRISKAAEGSPRIPRESSTVKRTRLSLRDSGGDAKTPEKLCSDKDNTQGSSNNRTAYNKELASGRKTTKCAPVLVEAVVNLVHIEDHVLQKNCHAMTKNKLSNCDIVLDKSKASLTDLTDKKIVLRHSRRRDVTPTGTDYQDSGINVSNSSPVKDSPQEEVNRKVTADFVHRKSRRKSRSRTCEEEGTRDTVENLNTSVAEKEISGGQGHCEEEPDACDIKRRKSCPVLSAKRKLAVESDEEGVSTIGKRSKNNEKGVLTMEERSKSADNKQHKSVHIDQRNNLSESSQTEKVNCSNERNSAKKTTIAGKSVGSVDKDKVTKIKEATNKTDEKFEGVEKENFEDNRDKIPPLRNEEAISLETSAPKDHTLEGTNVKPQETVASPNLLESPLKKVTPQMIQSPRKRDRLKLKKTVTDGTPVTNHQHRLGVLNNENGTKCSVSTTVNALKDSKERRHTDGELSPVKKGGHSASTAANPLKERRHTDGELSPVKKGVRLSDQVAIQCKLKTAQQSPEEKAVLKKKRRIKKKLHESWQVLSDRSMKRLLESEGDQEFEGYTTESIQEADLPFDVSYIDLTEVEYSDNSEIEWIFNEAEENHSPQYLPPIHNFLKKEEVAADRASSKWNEPIDCFVTTCVQKEQTRRVTRISAQQATAAEHKQILLDSSEDTTKNDEQTMEKSIVEECKGNPKHMLRRVFSRYLSGGDIVETLWVDSSEPSEKDVLDTSNPLLGMPDITESQTLPNEREIGIQLTGDVSKPHKLHRDLKPQLKSPNNNKAVCDYNRNNRTNHVQQQSSFDANGSLFVNTSQCETADVIDALSPEIPVLGKGASNTHTMDVSSPEIPFIAQTGIVTGKGMSGRKTRTSHSSEMFSPEIPFITRNVRKTEAGAKKLMDMQVSKFGGVMHSTPLHSNACDTTNSVDNTGHVSAMNAWQLGTPKGIQAISQKTSPPQRQTSIAISDTTVPVYPRFTRRSLAGIFESSADDAKLPKKKCAGSVSSTAESASQWKITDDMDGQIEIDEEIIFNYNSPQKFCKEFSPLKDPDVAYLRRLNSSLGTENAEHSGNAVRNLSSALLSQAGLQIETILAKRTNSQDLESEKSVEIPYVGSRSPRKILQSPVVKEIKSKAMYKFDYMSVKKSSKLRESQRRWFRDRVNRSRKVLSASSAKNKENCTPSPESPTPQRKCRVHNTVKKDKQQSPKSRQSRYSETNKKKTVQDDNISTQSSRSGSEFRVNIMMKKMRKRGCLCHEHKPASKCPNAHESKKLPSSPDYRRNSLGSKTSAKKRTRSTSPLKAKASLRKKVNKDTDQGEESPSKLTKSFERKSGRTLRQGKSPFIAKRHSSSKRHRDILNESESTVHGNNRSKSCSPSKRTPSLVVNEAKLSSPKKSMALKRSRSSSLGNQSPRKKIRTVDDNNSTEFYCVNKKVYHYNRLSDSKTGTRKRSGVAVPLKRSEISPRKNVSKREKTRVVVPKSPAIASKSPGKNKHKASGTTSRHSSRMEQSLLPSISKELKSESTAKSNSSSYLLQRLCLQISDADVCASFSPLRTRSGSSVSSEELPQRLSDFLQSQGSDAGSVVISGEKQAQESQNSVNSGAHSRRSRKTNSPQKTAKNNAPGKESQSKSSDHCVRNNTKLKRKTEVQGIKDVFKSEKSSSCKFDRKTASPFKERLRRKVCVTLKPLSPTTRNRLQIQGHVLT